MTPIAIEERLDAIIRELRASDTDKSGFSARRIDPDGILPAYGAVRNVDGAPCIVIDRIDPRLAHGETAFEAAGLRVYRAPGTDGGVAIVLALEDQSARGLFGRISCDAVHAASLERDIIAAVSVFVGRLRAWQSFLRRSSDGLTDAEATGLLGELLVLEALAAAWSWREGLAAWQGPSGGVHDFVRRGMAAEIKTATGHSKQLHVSGLDQLDDRSLEALFLVTAHLEESHAGSSLPDIVDRCVSAAAAEQASIARALRGELLKAGYSDADSQKYTNRRLTVMVVRAYRVRTGFPRLTRPSVSTEIVDVRYSLDPARLGNFIVREGGDARFVPELFGG